MLIWQDSVLLPPVTKATILHTATYMRQDSRYFCYLRSCLKMDRQGKKSVFQQSKTSSFALASENFKYTHCHPKPRLFTQKQYLYARSVYPAASKYTTCKTYISHRPPTMPFPPIFYTAKYTRP
jgi:hypothetical protein